MRDAADFRGVATAVDCSGQDEQEVGKAIQIRNREIRFHRIHRLQAHNTALRRPAEGSDEMAQRTRLAAAGQDQIPQRRQTRVQFRDGAFDPVDTVPG